MVCTREHEDPMAQSSTLTVRLPAETKAKLARLAGATKRTSSFLAGEAIAAHVERELAIIEAIERGQADVRAGRVHSTADVFRDAEAAIAETEAASGQR